MRLLSCLVGVFLGMVGCAPVEYKSSGLPEGYSGQTATIRDTFQSRSEKESTIYYTASVDGIPLKNAAQRTREATKDATNAQRIWPISASRQVPAGEITLKLVVAEASVTPLFSSFGTSRVISEEVTLVAQPGEEYLVRGAQSWDGAAVWVETVDGEVVSDVVGNKKLLQQRRRVEGEHPPRIARFLNLAGGETEASIKSRFGEPDQVYRNDRLEREYGLDRVVLQYDGLGRLNFNVYDGERYLDHSGPTDETNDPELLFGFFVQASKVDKRLLIKRMYRDKQPMDIDLLDRMASYVWYHRNVFDRDTKDALAWICKELGRRGNGRYNHFLKKLDASVSSRRLKRHANASITEYVDEGVTQFSVE